VTSREPLWDQRDLRKAVDAGRFYLPGSATGVRETIVTSPIEAEPQYLMRVAGPGWSPLLAAFFTAAFFLLLTVKFVVVAVVCGLLAVAMIWIWMWESDPPPLPRVRAGKDVLLPTYVHGPMSHSYWAVVVLLLVIGSLYLSYFFSYLYLWTVNPAAWVAAGSAASALASGMLLVASLASLTAARRALAREARVIFVGALLFGLAALVASLTLNVANLWESGLRPPASGYGAIVYANDFLQMQVVVALTFMAMFALAREAANKLDKTRSVVFDNLELLWRYAIGQGLVGLLLVHAFPRVAL
jgi:cytochrome c oxidase subunit I+III